MKQKILVAGSSNIDFVVGVKEMPEKGETIICKSFANIPGGKGANQACACGKLEGECTFLSALGSDSMGDMMMDSLRSAHVDTTRIRRIDGVPSGMAMIMVNEEGENSIVVIPGANAMCDKLYFDENKDALHASEIVLAQLETPVDSIYALLIEAKKLGKLTVLNPAPAPDSIPDEVLKNLDFITPNETELSKLSGLPTQTMDEIAAAANALIQRGVKNVLVTIGSRGALLCNAQGSTHFPTVKATAVDTTAAGDTFNAAFAVALSEGTEVPKAIRFANIAASISITRKGAQTSIPSRQEVDAMLQNI